MFDVRHMSCSSSCAYAAHVLSVGVASCVSSSSAGALKNRACCGHAGAGLIILCLIPSVFTREVLEPAAEAVPVIGPFIGTLFMFYLIDLSSGITTAYMLFAGVALVALTLFAPQGLMGEVRRRVWRGLP